MERKLFMKLILQLGLLFVLLVALHKLLNWDGFFLSLASNVLTLVITLSYVDHVLRQREVLHQAPAVERVNNRLGGFCKGSLIICCTSVHVEWLTDNLKRMKDPSLYDRVLIDFTKGTLQPLARSLVEALDTKEWHQFAREMRVIGDGADKLLDQFERHLDPERYALIADIHTAASWVQSFALSFLNAVGKTDGKAEALKQLAAEHFEQLIKLLCQLVERVGPTKGGSHTP